MSGNKPPDPPPPQGAVGGVPPVAVTVNSSASTFSSSTVTMSVTSTMATSEGGSTTTPSSPATAMDTTEAGTQSPTTMARIVNPYAGVEQKLIIFLTKEENSRANYRCGTAEMSKLVFTHLKIPSDNVITIEQGKMNEIWVHTKGINVNDYKVPAQIKVKEGVYTMPMRAFRRPVKVSVDWARFKTPDECIIKMLSNFGEVVDGKVYDHFHLEGTAISKCTEEEKLIKGKPNGNKWCHLFMDRDIPSYGLLQGPDANEDPWRVRIHYGRQPTTCARCHQGRRGCRGGANASKCKKNGGKAVDFEDFWNVVIANPVKHGAGKEPEPMGNRMKLEGFAKNTKLEDILNKLVNEIIHRDIADDDIKWNDKRGTLTINDVTHAEINTACAQVSGTQWQGRTIWVTPILVPSARKILARSPDARDTNEDIDVDVDEEELSSDDESDPGKTNQSRQSEPAVIIQPDALGGAGPGAVLMSTLKTGGGRIGNVQVTKVVNTQIDLTDDEQREEDRWKRGGLVGNDWDWHESQRTDLTEEEQRKRDRRIIEDHKVWLQKIADDPKWERDSLGREVERTADNSLLRVYHDDAEEETFRRDKERCKIWTAAIRRESKRMEGGGSRRKILKKQAEAALQKQAEEEMQQEKEERERVEREKAQWEVQKKRGFGKKSPRSDSGRSSSMSDMSRVSASGVSPMMSSSGSPGTPPTYTGVQQQLLARLETVMTPNNTVPDTPVDPEKRQPMPSTSEDEDQQGAEEAEGDEPEGEEQEDDEEDAKSINISEEEDSINEMVNAFVTNTGKKKKNRKRTASQSPKEPGVTTRSRQAKSSKMSGGGSV